MKKTSSNPNSSLDRVRSWARTKAHGPSPLSSPRSSSRNNLPNTSTSRSTSQNELNTLPQTPKTARQSTNTSNNTTDVASTNSPPPAPPPQDDGQGTVIEPETEEEKEPKKNVALRFWDTGKAIILSSYINWLLVFVPIGIAAKCAKLSPGIIFAMNAIAIIPLAGLLSHATESVAKRMGDTVGALMNVTFGNAVELIIFIALAKDEIRIVQASLLGSILANLLLILGMSFLLGGLRFQEQIYNSTVTQMSACLLSLSVMSLLLPTAFHASFSTEQSKKANSAVLKVSRGTSVVLLIVYGLYLLFQLKSHAYMYQSTPQHIIDEESAPGPVAQWMDSSSDSSSDCSSSDSDDSRGSNTTAKRIKRAFTGRRRRKSSAGSDEKAAAAAANRTRTSSVGTHSIPPASAEGNEEPQHAGHRFGAIDFAEDGDDETRERSRRGSHASVAFPSKKERKALRKEKERRRREKKELRRARENADTITEGVPSGPGTPGVMNEKAEQGPEAPRRVDFVVVDNPQTLSAQPGAEAIPVRPRIFPGISIRPAIPKTFSQNVFTMPAPTPPPVGPIPRVKMGIRRTNSLPDRLNQSFTGPARAPSTGVTTPHVNSTTITDNNAEQDEDNISRTTAVLLLLISTGLVAVCAEFMVDSINAVVASNSGISETFIGLIILPIVGNAAEHVTAVTVATKNKMDLAIGVAVGSSIQIALFVTPFVVLLGWAMGREMSLYFTLFETVCLFVSAFIVNFLVLDGRSNYLEGALLCAAYVIIAVAAFFYPGSNDQSNLGGNDKHARMIGALVGM